MPAPSADFPALGASTSSSGYTDGLGRRTLAFDREDGTMLERLVVRAELSAFERSLRDRLERIAAMDDERIAKPRSIERSPDGTLVVLSEFVPGSRLSDLLDATAQQGSVPGVDVALGFLLDVLPALCGLHAGGGFAHGAMTPGRTVLTPASQVVLLDGIFGDALSRLQYSRQRLWLEFGLAMPPAAGPSRFDASSDIGQAALSAVMLMLGRPIAEDEYPHAIPSLVAEVVEVAQIRGSTEFAAGLQKFLQRSLPLPGRRPYTAADDALIELRDLARELGLDVCRRALVEFIEQQDTSGQPSLAFASGDDADGYSYRYAVGDDWTAASTDNGDSELEADAGGDGLEIDLDLDGRAEASEQEDTVYDLSAGTEEEQPAVQPEPEAFVVPPEPEEVVAKDETLRSEEPLEAALHPDAFVPPEPEPLPETTPLTPEPVAFDPAPFLDEPVGQAASTEAPAEPVVTAADALEDALEEDSTPEEQAETEHAIEATELAAEGVEDSETVEESKHARRRKRSRSARSRKDKLRSVARPQSLTPAAKPAPPPPAPPPPAPPPPAPIAVAKPTTSGWLVEPSRATSFEPPLPVTNTPAPPAAAPRPAPIALAPPPPPLPPVTPLQPPQVVAPVPVPMPRPIAPPPPPAPLPLPVQKTPVVAPQPAPGPALKLKSEPPVGYSPPRKSRADTAEDIYSPRSAPPEAEQASAFPWKLAGAAVVLVGVLALAGRAYLWGGSKPETPTTTATTAPVAAPVSAAAPKTGKVQVTTQPSGARVLLAGKHLGDAPLTVELPAGRHTLTFATSSDSVRRTVRVEAGKTLTLDVPIFRGWLDVVAPIILEVSENGKSIGDTEQSQLLLAPGRHELTFTNRDLDYTSTHVVEIVPGEGRRLTIDPRGTANLNASPWAEVWVNGKKLGDTPLANQPLPLGTHEIVFKHPQFGERRMTTTIRANAPVALSVDMSKQ